MANFLLSSVKPLNEYFISVNPYENTSELKISYKGLRESINHLKDGGLLCIFPAGGVSAYDLKTNAIRDREWQPSALKFIKSAGVPVIPICLSGSNSLLFHVLGLINPRLRNVKLPSEILNKKDKKITVRIGGAIRTDEQKEFSDIHEFGRYLRTRTYLLGKDIAVKPFFRPRMFKKKAREIGIARDPELIIKEIESLENSEYKLYENKEYQVFWAISEMIPNLLYEIGRLREITFREVGEGTGKNIDLDEYDLYYRHLFIWDKENKALVGAYRLGMGKEILSRYGKRGFYLNSLFKLKKGFKPILEHSIELGRSFIVKEYQLKPLSLFMLWKGILYFILKNPYYRYLIGPVTISGAFSNQSKFLMTSFIKHNFFDYQLASLVEPRKEYIPKIVPSDADLEVLEKVTKKDIKKLDKIIAEIEIGNFRIPALLKKYLGQNAKIIAFNVDPKFNNSLDGLLVMDLFNVPFDTIEGLSKELNDSEILENFPGKSGK
jgi:putative hemolysin